MKLAELRRLAVRQNVRIRFHISGGHDCVVDEHGVARVPTLRGVPDFNLETEVERVETFTLEGTQSRNLTREQLAALSTGSGTPPAEEHEE